MLESGLSTLIGAMPTMYSKAHMKQLYLAILTHIMHRCNCYQSTCFHACIQQWCKVYGLDCCLSSLDEQQLAALRQLHRILRVWQIASDI